MPRRRRRRAKPLRREIVRVVRQLIPRPELKYWEFNGAGTYPSVLGTLGAFPSVAQGVTGTTRVGQRINIHSVLIRLTITNSANNTGNVQSRFIVGIDRENPLGTTPTAAQILSTAVVQSPLNISTTRGVYRILTDKFQVLSPATVVASIPAGTMQMNAVAGSSRNIRVFKRFRFPMVQNYDGPNAGDFQAKNLFYMLLSSAAAPNDPIYNIYLRCMFTDG